MNGHELSTSSPRQSKNQTDVNQFVLTFENNRYASELFGQFDQQIVACGVAKQIVDQLEAIEIEISQCTAHRCIVR